MVAMGGDSHTRGLHFLHLLPIEARALVRVVRRHEDRAGKAIFLHDRHDDGVRVGVAVVEGEDDRADRHGLVVDHVFIELFHRDGMEIVILEEFHLLAEMFLRKDGLVRRVILVDADHVVHEDRHAFLRHGHFDLLLRFFRLSRRFFFARAAAARQ